MKCTVCEENEVEVVCHHCGRPLCTQPSCDHIIIDPVFNDSTGLPYGLGNERAHHCIKCLENYHPSEYKVKASR